MASWVRPRRIAIFGALSAAVLGVSAVGVATVSSLTGTSHSAAASVAASNPLPPIDSDVLSDGQAKDRDRALRKAESDALKARLATGDSAEIPTEQISEPPLDAPALPGFTGRDMDCTRLKCVALTFDDGPGSETDRLLGMLRAANAVATWFPLGEVTADSPERLKAIAEAGMEIGNHSWSHPELTTLSDRGVESQISRTSREVESVTGKKPYLVRPPYGAISRRVARDLGRLDSPAILWDVDPLDWKYLNSDRVYRSVMSQVRPGSIVLMHDIHPTTVAAIPRILKALTDRGYTYVTVSELFGGKLLPGHIYTDNHAAYQGAATTGRKD
jgi:peptidoglycan/xylan/chitin deacetylase (PgdA/CDA1 family)